MLVVAFLAPLPVIGYVTVIGSRKSVEDKAQTYASTASVLAKNIDGELQDIELAIHNVTGLVSLPYRDQNNEVVPRSKDYVVNLMNRYIDVYDRDYYTMLLDSEGNLFAVNNQDHKGKQVDTTSLYERNYASEPWFKSTKKQSAFHVEDLHIDEQARKIFGDEGLAISFSKPISDGNGKVIGVWRSVTRFSAIEKHILQTYFELREEGNPSAEITMLDSKGRVIIDCDPTKTGKDAIVRDLAIIGKFNLADKGVAAAENVVQGEAGWLMESWHARKKINQVAGYSPLSGKLKWNVLVRVACTEAYAAANESRHTIVRTIVTTGVLMLIFAVVFSGVLARQLQRIMGAMEAAENGDYTKSKSCWFSRDLYRLSIALQKMQGTLSEAAERNADYTGQIKAISNNSAVIEFDPSGRIQTANENFCRTFGYELSEIQGQHHRMLVDPEFGKTTKYDTHWQELRDGNAVSGEFNRFAKDGHEIWIQASYNPILDVNGNVIKIVKYATDITVAKKLQMDVEAKRETEQQHVSALLEVVNQVADGRFDIDVPDLGTDAIGQVGTALGTAIESIRSALCKVSNVSSTVAAASEEMSSGAEEISRGAQQQAARLEETAASLEEITCTVKRNSENAQEARALVNGSREVATIGGEVVSEAVEAMLEINKSSKRISDIITTIDEIAFQTNLLALNAAVEAARAGEQGRGFAVVASEVRNLAQRSATSAKEIKDLIVDSNSKVERGTKLVNQSGDTLGEIVKSVKRVTDIVSEIAAASQEQLAGIQQVNQAVSQMDQVTQTNASQTEEMAGTSGSVLNHVRQLEQMVGQFQLGDQPAADSFNYGCETASNEQLSEEAKLALVQSQISQLMQEPTDDFMEF